MVWARHGEAIAKKINAEMKTRIVTVQEDCQSIITHHKQKCRKLRIFFFEITRGGPVLATARLDGCPAVEPHCAVQPVASRAACFYRGKRLPSMPRSRKFEPASDKCTMSVVTTSWAFGPTRVRQPS